MSMKNSLLACGVENFAVIHENKTPRLYFIAVFVCFFYKIEERGIFNIHVFEHYEAIFANLFLSFHVETMDAMD